ncbi:MAG: hypothetical protein A2204_01655 [Elusimicrobia bacterium RIFOXYA1_FULL_47_7]|nr:MAG: hypothetical protein A2204_01655 [Elusimicrobia bacterium RIFOXYA1_FULL_47_7]OGS10409.1 MAG: hypothetical protein A2386_07150 [Elusimicrobia bacterium RIFOXYB1_FULL_48_9]OGS16714.1 MAG: hypothetical protein A2251_00845 [Elusimicrobia bacterium RIFOXYA2_FULL_47_53]OGS26767.1 MAG: hypothetical protein A2339_04100 [Elusimicrobia bacterium RIFOXYB12_FULL_50_12]OGS31673.1 MAG: hypothetical protein A2323_05675 [Elusimicrobia bacterium RIFOXYB2_FULL_46_23]
MIVNKVKINGRIITYGKATHKELERMNIEKDFNSALKVMSQIRATRMSLFGVNNNTSINTKIYGKRKAN